MSGLGDAFSVEESPSSADDSDGIEVAVVRLGVEVLGEAEEAEFDDSELVEETVVCWVGFAGSAGRTLSEYRTLLYPGSSVQERAIAPNGVVPLDVTGVT